MTFDYNPVEGLTCDKTLGEMTACELQILLCWTVARLQKLQAAVAPRVGLPDRVVLHRPIDDPHNAFDEIIHLKKVEHVLRIELRAA